jgi:hypothetical protein
MDTSRRRFVRVRTLFALAFLATGSCVGAVGDNKEPGAAGPGGPPPKPGGATSPPPILPSEPGGPSAKACDGPLDPGPSFIRKLNRREYNNTVRDLLDPTTSAGRDFAAEERRLGFDNNAVALNVSPLLVEQYLLSAEDLAARALDKGLVALLPGCDPAKQGEDVCARRFIETFGKRAYRRPVPAEDVAILWDAYLGGKAAGGWRAGIEAALATMLQAPRFLYRVEESAPGLSRLDPWELASRLSYFLWGSMPDDELFAAAEGGRLATADQVAAQVKRMLAAPKAREIVASFHEQWLELDHIGDLEKDAAVYPGFTATIAKGMRAEVTAFLNDVTWQGGGDLTALFAAPYTFVDKALARYYKLPEPAQAGLHKVALDGTGRAGLLGQGGLMAMLASTNQSSPVARGKFVREQLLCAQMPPPPMDVVIELPKLDPNLTTRERFRQHAEDPACSGCHRLMDPIGLGFEGFDGAGLTRTTEAGRALDLSGEIVDFGGDGRFVGPLELARKLESSPMVQDCVVRQWFRFAMGRAEVEGTGDVCSLRKVAQRFHASGFKFLELVQALTETEAFTHKKGGVR